MATVRYVNNSIIKPEDIKPSREYFKVVGVFNPGVIKYKDQVILLLRVAEKPIKEKFEIRTAPVYDVQKKQITFKDFPKADSYIDFSDPRVIITPQGTYLTAISHLRLAKSSDGVNFQIDDRPTIFSENQYETFGVEDCRITQIDDTFYITYAAVSKLGITTALISTRDFSDYKRHGIIFCPDNKDVTIFPEKINGIYCALHRPSSSFGKSNEMWLAESPDLLCWGNHRFVMSARESLWDSARIGASAVPFMTEKGWIEIYHGADENKRYCLGAALLDKNQPWKVIARAKSPVFEPKEKYEQKGFFSNAVFTCGLLREGQNIKLYYGAADTSICLAQLDLEDIFKSFER